MLAICLLTLNMGGIDSVQARLPGILASLWVVGSMFGIAEAARRYTVGASLRAPAGVWSPPVPASVLVIVAGLAMVTLAALTSRRRLK